MPSDSPAIKQIGFIGSDTTSFGVKTAVVKAKAATPAFPVHDYSGTATQTSNRLTLAIGATVESVTTAAQQSSLGLPTVLGVQVDSALIGGRAAMSGLQENDAIVSGGTTTVATIADLSNTINQANGASLALRVYRYQSPVIITLKTK
ncbi:hypothetical protein [Burkholderia contaminans]|uniref:hypothetical protein n=1 Tax=Burkholderia contaminans TaxID=488447 RepID=UPI00158BF66E|nr:hypothetical protein [Burkholderia contaminans]